MMFNSRVVAVTGGLVVAGAICGAISGSVAIIVAVLVVLRHFAVPAWIGAASAIGAIFGAAVAPLFSWILLRDVPIGRAVVSIAAGSGVGGAIGVIVGAASVNPYEPLTLGLPPVPQGVAGAAVGAAFAAVYLRYRQRSASRAAPANDR